MTVSGSNAVDREVRIAAKPETVFEFFTDPAKMVRWMGLKAALDPRPGGIYRVEINPQAIAKGEYVEIDPPSRLLITFGWDSENHPIPPGSSKLEVTFSPDGDGTLVRLIHSGLPADAVADHAHGWEHYLARLAIAVSGGDPGPDPNATGSMESK